MSGGGRFDQERLDRAVAEARQNRDQRERGYRQQALKLYPWVCGRCQREFTRTTVHELTVHHRDHNHDNNPADGSNWELLCLYCHDNEHRRFADQVVGAGYEMGAQAAEERATATHKPFSELAGLLGKRSDT